MEIFELVSERTAVSQSGADRSPPRFQIRTAECILFNIIASSREVIQHRVSRAGRPEKATRAAHRLVKAREMTRRPVLRATVSVRLQCCTLPPQCNRTRAAAQPLPSNARSSAGVTIPPTRSVCRSSDGVSDILSSPVSTQRCTKICRRQFFLFAPVAALASYQICTKHGQAVPQRKKGPALSRLTLAVRGIKQGLSKS
jgi:hypothetical protein